MRRSTSFKWPQLRPRQSRSKVTVPYAQSQTPGNMNIVVVGWHDAASTLKSVTDSLGNTYKLAIGPTTGQKLRQKIYYAPNILPGINTVINNIQRGSD